MDSERPAAAQGQTIVANDDDKAFQLEQLATLNPLLGLGGNQQGRPGV